MSVQTRLVSISFLSTLSLRRATCGCSGRCRYWEYFYPRSPCGERLSAELRVFPVDHFYPRSPCGERLGRVEVVQRMLKFLSTLSLRRATLAGPSGPAFLFNFYPRSPCGERRGLMGGLSCDRRNFYPRSPCGERRLFFGRDAAKSRFLSTLSLRRATQKIRFVAPDVYSFLSTLSLRRATRKASSIFLPIRISIHALLAESDASLT